MALTFSALTNLTISNNESNTSIGQPRVFSFRVDTNKAPGALADMVLYIRPVQWINGSFFTEQPGTAPSNSYFELVNNSTTVLNVLYNATFISGTNANNNINLRCTVMYTNPGGPNRIRITITYYSINIFDTLDYLNNDNLNNQNKLLKDAVSNTQILSNSQIDSYSNIRQFRIGLWCREPSLAINNQLSFIRYSLEDFPKFYFGADTRYNGNWSNAFFQATYCGQSSSQISTVGNTLITFNATKILAAAVTQTNWSIIRTDTNNQTLNLIDNYEWNNTDTTFVQPYATTHLLTNSRLTAPATAFAGTTSTMSIIGATLVNLARYRFIVIIRTTVAGVNNYWSFISQEYVATNCQCFTPPLKLTSVLSDYRSVLSDNIIATPQERIQSTISLDFTPYNASTQALFPNTLQSICLEFFNLDTVNNLKHIYSDECIFKNLSNNYTIPPSFVSFSLTGNILTISNLFRIRYEYNQPNQDTINVLNSASLGPLSTMDWTNKTISLNWIITLTDGQVTNTITIPQQILVHEYDENYTNILTHTLTDEFGNPLTPTICNTEDQIKICTQTTDPGGDFISGLDKANFGIDSFIEHESWVGVLPQLLNAAVISQDAAFAPEACTFLNVSLLPNSTDLRFISIRKDSPPVSLCCVNPGINILPQTGNYWFTTTCGSAGPVASCGSLTGGCLIWNSNAARCFRGVGFRIFFYNNPICTGTGTTGLTDLTPDFKENCQYRIDFTIQMTVDTSNPAATKNFILDFIIFNQAPGPIIPVLTVPISIIADTGPTVRRYSTVFTVPVGGAKNFYFNYNGFCTSPSIIVFAGIIANIQCYCVDDLNPNTCENSGNRNLISNGEFLAGDNWIDSWFSPETLFPLWSYSAYYPQNQTELDLFYSGTSILMDQPSISKKLYMVQPIVFVPDPCCYYLDVVLRNVCRAPGPNTPDPIVGIIDSTGTIITSWSILNSFPICPTQINMITYSQDFNTPIGGVAPYYVFVLINNTTYPTMVIDSIRLNKVIDLC